jgi:hypothetical protein
MVIGDTGISAPTKESVGDVTKLWEADKQRWDLFSMKLGASQNRPASAIEVGT